MINTSRGAKSPLEALILFKQAKLSAGELLGIFNQLQGYPEGMEAREYVLSHPVSYNEKLQRLAKEKSAGRPLGAKVINNESDLTTFIAGCGLRARVAVTVRKEQARRVFVLLCLPCLEVDEMAKIGLMAVAASGDWQSVPRTFTATLSLTSEAMKCEARSALLGVVEKVELMSTFTERVQAYRAPMPLSEEVKATLASNPDLFFDRGIFLKVCEERGFNHVKASVDELPDNATMENAMMLFLSNSSRQDFLEYYVTRLMDALA